MTAEEAIELLLHCQTATQVLVNANELLANHPQLKQDRDVVKIVVDTAYNMDQRRWEHLQAVAEVLNLTLIEIEPYPQPNASSIYIRT